MYNILPLETLYKFSITIQMFKIYKGYLPPVISDVFKIRTRINERKTRLTHIFEVPFTHLSFVQRNIHINGPILFNEYCSYTNIKCSLYTFKRSLKQRLMSELKHNVMLLLNK